MALIPKTSHERKHKPPFNPLNIDCPATDNISLATVAMVGEYPSSTEVLEQEPFIGPAGSQLNRACAAVQLPRYQIYLTNCCKAELPKNNPNKLWTEKGYRCPEWGELQSNLIHELMDFKGNIIITLGATATLMLLGENKYSKIGTYRGSIYKTDDFPHLKRKLPGKFIMPSYHPAFTLAYKNPLAFYIMIMDFKKALRVSDDPTLLDQNLQLTVKPTFEQVMQFYSFIESSIDLVGFDIEATPKFVTCFSFSCKLSNGTLMALCVPLISNSGNYWTIEQEVQIWTGMARILVNPKIKKIMQNGMFDCMFMLRQMDILTDNFHFDTMLAQHLVYTELPKGLDFLTSIYTYFPYYKDEGKSNHQSLVKDWESYWYYNCKDSAYLIPIMENLLDELESFDCLPAMAYQMELHKPLMEMEFNGILTDQEGIIKYKQVLKRKISAMQHGLNNISGRELNINSSKQLIAYFYGHLMIKPYINRKTGRPKCDTVALHRIAKKGLKGSNEARLIIKMRKYHKLLSTYFRINVDSDNKLRCTYKISGTVSGRIASEKTYYETPTGEKTGANLQNQPPVYKKFLMADPGHIICEFDLAKAEAHVVAFLCQDANMIESFESGIDVHSFNASKIFNVPIEEVIDQHRNGTGEPRKKMRYMGKKVVHASNYNMGPQTFSDQLAVEDVFMSVSECKQLLLNYQDRFPGLKRWHRSIDQEIREHRVLYNLFGRPRRFLGTINSALFRNAYSYKPQSTVAELLNKGLINIANDPRLGQNGYNIDLLTTVHDSGVAQFPLPELTGQSLSMILTIIKDHMTYTFTHLGRSFTIGLDATIGFRWKGKTYELSDFSETECAKALEVIGVN